ncbi:hypothetical protein FS842_009588 [Serendipita sp. 407]|nr:hypothetical protein FRC20_011191 [Serendipita sp. 405]KAG9052609.1 hypothetical protein FS842_009588 [Serendipita sp. 407]
MGKNYGTSFRYLMKWIPAINLQLWCPLQFFLASKRSEDVIDVYGSALQEEEAVLSNVSPMAIDLPAKALKFDPNKRVSVEEA